MAEPENRAKVTLQELMVVMLSMTDALSKLLIENGVITDEEFKKKLRGERATYQAILKSIEQ
jgi:predicted transcriptional regulator